MADAATSENPRLVQVLARALLAAARCRALYPGEHPAVISSLARLQTALADATREQSLGLGVAPAALVLDDGPLLDEGPGAEAAALLHDRDILRVLFGQQPGEQVVRAFVDLIAQDPGALRARGGPAEVWAAERLEGIAITQVDYRRVLEDREQAPSPARHDDVWEAIVRSVLERKQVLDDTVQRRLLEIAADAGAVRELALAVMAPNCTPDGSPLITSQAAAVIAAFNHLQNIVALLAPERRDEMIRNLASATAGLDLKVLLQMMRAADEEPAGSPGAASAAAAIMKQVASAFDDMKVAQLLAATLALEGQASGRLAAVFETIAPEEDRRHRVLPLARALLSASEFGQREHFDAFWQSTEELLMSYNERPFVSAAYAASLDRAGERATRMAAAELPPELAGWLETLDQDHVRRLSVTLLIDLLALESSEARASGLAADLSALAEDMLMAGDYEGAAEIAAAMADQATRRGAVSRDACLATLDALSTSLAVREAVALLEDMDDAEYGHFRRLATAIGPPIVEALRDVMTIEDGLMVRARARAVETIVAFGAAAVTRLTPLIGHSTWYVQRNACELLETIAAPEGVPLIQPLLRNGDPRVVRQAVKALSNIDDPAAARAVHTVLRAATGELRRAVVNALAAERDVRVVPVLSRMLAESDALGSDHHVVLEMLEALGTFGDIVTDPAVGTVAGLMRKRRWFARKKARTLAQTSITVLHRVGTPAAHQAIADAVVKGDRLLRRIAASQ